MNTHWCPFCGRTHERDEPNVPINRPCPECWLNRGDAIIIMTKEELATILEILVRADDQILIITEDAILNKIDIKHIYEKLAKQVYPSSDETIATIMKEKN